MEIYNFYEDLLEVWLILIIWDLKKVNKYLIKKYDIEVEELDWYNQWMHFTFIHKWCNKRIIRIPEYNISTLVHELVHFSYQALLDKCIQEKRNEMQAVLTTYFYDKIIKKIKEFTS